VRYEKNNNMISATYVLEIGDSCDFLLMSEKTICAQDLFTPTRKILAIYSMSVDKESDSITSSF